MTDKTPETVVLPGAVLRKAREDAGLSVQDMATSLNLGVEVVQALEADQYDALPGLPFVRGYLTNYHRKLGLPKEWVLDPFDAWRGKSRPTPVAAAITKGSISAQKPPQPIAGKVFAGVVLLILVIWATVFDGAQSLVTWVSPVQEARDTSQLEEGAAVTPSVDITSTGLPANEPAPLNFDAVVESASEAPEAPVVAELTTTTEISEPAALPVEPEVAEPEPTQPEPIVELATDEHRLQMRFSGDSWVEISNGAGERLVADLMNGSDTVDLVGTGPFQILVGNVAATQLVFDGEVLDLPSRARQNVARIQLP